MVLRPFLNFIVRHVQKSFRSLLWSVEELESKWRIPEAQRSKPMMLSPAKPLLELASINKSVGGMETWEKLTVAYRTSNINRNALSELLSASPM